MTDEIPEANIIWDEAKAHIEKGNVEKAIEIYKYILVRYSDNATAVECANAYLGDIYLGLKELDLAEMHIKKAINYQPENPDYHYLLGFVYSKKVRWANAIKEFEKAIEKQPDNDEYLRSLGWAFFNNGDKNKGLKFLNKALEMSPSNVNVLTDLAVAHASMMEFEKAMQYAEEAMMIDPDNKFTRKISRDINFSKKESQRLTKKNINKDTPFF